VLAIINGLLPFGKVNAKKAVSVGTTGGSQLPGLLKLFPAPGFNDQIASTE
jgi:hypothetical protein